MFSYICHHYYRITNGDKKLLKSYIVKPADPSFIPSSTFIMPLSDWRDDLTFEDLTNLHLQDSVEGNKDAVYLDIVQETINGCMHYPLNCHVICPKCNKDYACRFCHNDDLSSQCDEMDRFSITSIRCLLCNKVGPIGVRCIHCNGEVAKSFCPKCNYISMVSSEVKPFFHCESCMFCRVGKQEEHRHCDICKQCYKNQFFDTHKCDATDYVCCICQEELKTSIYDHTEIGCGNRHYIHTKCFHNLIKAGNYTCPLCRKLFWKGKVLQKITNQHTIFFMLCLLVRGYVTPEPVAISNPLELEPNGTLHLPSSSSDHSEDDEEGSSEPTHHGEEHEQGQDQNSQENNTASEEFPYFSQELSDKIRGLFAMNIAMFMLDMKLFLKNERISGRCRQCSKCFWVPNLNISDIPCVYCGLFNVDIISSKEADSLPSESEFASTWREYIESYRLNVAKHAAYIRNTLKYLNDHFAQLLLLG